MITAEEIAERKVIAISRGIKSSYIVQVAQALLDGGITMMEVTFNPSDEKASEDTLKSIALLKEKFGREMHIGAGTVLTTEQAEKAWKAGAEYIISPNTNEAVIRRTKELGLISIPGAMTPTEAQAAWEAGCDFVKIFPAGDLGAGYIKSVKSSLSQLKVIATGGIDEKNIPEFIKCGSTGFGIGGKLVNKAAAEAGDFDKIRKKAAEIAEAAGIGAGCRDRKNEG